MTTENKTLDNAAEDMSPEKLRELRDLKVEQLKPFGFKIYDNGDHLDIYAPNLHRFIEPVVMRDRIDDFLKALLDNGFIFIEASPKDKFYLNLHLIDKMKRMYCQERGKRVVKIMAKTNLPPSHKLPPLMRDVFYPAVYLDETYYFIIQDKIKSLSSNG